MIFGRASLAPLLFASLALAACATTRSTTDLSIGPRASDYAPLAVGSRWTYAMSYPGQQGEMTVTITGEKDGYFVDDHEGAFRHTPDGLRDRQRYLVRHPLQAGATWKTVVSASAVEHNQILSVGERCETAAGAFPDCLVVESSIRRDQNVTLIIRWTWAKGVGLAKLETEADIAGKGRVPQVKQSLLRYDLKGAGAGGTTPRAADPAPRTEKTDQDGAPGTWEK